jgi:hypothetical protein
MLLAILQIREGRYQTPDECLVREYRMTVNGILKQFSHEFCEVCSSCCYRWILFYKYCTNMLLLLLSSFQEHGKYRF